MDHLLITGCLSAEQLATVDSKGTTQERNRELLHILMRRSVRQLNLFYDCLKCDHLHLWDQMLQSKEKEVYTIDLIENADSPSTNISKDTLKRKQRILRHVEDISIDMAATLLEDTLYLIKKKKAVEPTWHQASSSGIQSVADLSMSDIRKMLTQILGTDDNMGLNITRLDNAYRILYGKRTYTLLQSAKIIGVTVVNQDVFVLCSQNGVKSVQKYDLASMIKTDEIKLDHITKWAFGIAGCSNKQALYIINSHREKNCLFRLDLTDSSFSHWGFPCNYWPWGVSVTSERTILVTFQVAEEADSHKFASRVVEYTSEGQQVREIIFDITVKYAYQTIQLSSDELVVSHGSGTSLHRVCVINTEGQIIKSYGG